MVSEYVVEIFEYMRSLEPAITPKADYMAEQKEISWKMRRILVDWLIEVQWKLKLLPETLFLTVNLVDRFLSERTVSLGRLQLVGLSATLLASKYEEVLTPSISNLIYLSDNSYEDTDLIKAERYMLQVLKYSLAYPNPLSYLRRVSKPDGYDILNRTMAKYLMEFALLEENLITWTPSFLAAVGIYIARQINSSGPWVSLLSF